MPVLGIGARHRPARGQHRHDVGGDVADAGLASGLANTSQQVAAALGVAALAALAAARTDAVAATGPGHLEACYGLRTVCEGGGQANATLLELL